MAIIQDRLSTVLHQADFLPPDERARLQREDYEAGPIALNDPSEGLFYQIWHLTWEPGTGNFIATPETTGSPQVVLNAASVIQCSLAFDQNGHINIVFTVVGGQVRLYWYDTALATWTTDDLDSDIVSAMLTMDDKRFTQDNANDILLIYTRDIGGGFYDMECRYQRDRYDTDYPLASSISHPYLDKCGMHDELRVQIRTTNLFV